ncbi:NADH-quinone oxidoreductase subunit N like [Actinidia chinensis var. chinensis]|uniref:NADH-quinone oxidoreductase subunit N like n=1 Tax=Actinidia chinensis var. chinensis TaxID=1590841 RepID=A0A2R6Q2Y6_ACTCC|nr:NADH-quinone oxidoreductase subunit N like [Actinidia chinensis var. chinensis]
MERNNNSNSNHNRERLLGGNVGGSDHGLLRTITTQPPPAATTSSDFVLQWGNRKRLRCMKIQVKDHAADPVHRTTVRVDRRVVRSDTNKDNNTSHQGSVITATANNGNGYLNLRQRSSSPSHRILRNSEISIAMKGHGNGVTRGFSSPDRGGAQDKRGGAHHNNPTPTTNNNNNNNDNNNNGGGGGGSGSTETAHDSKKGGGTSSGSEAIPAVWPPKFVIALTNKEKEEDFIAFKGSKLPQRPKKRAKFIQRTLNLVSPGAWLCDLTLERYEVREKKISKKRPRGLKAMGNMESDSE